jgi:4-oxalocrotonate tautomerase
MPEIVIFLAEGREPERKRAFMQDITDSAVRNFDVTAENVVVQIVESAKSNKMKGGQLFSERAPAPARPKA